MERYHIFKLGLAIIFYAAYCVRPMLVYSLKADDNLENNKNILNPENEYFQYFHGVEGKPGRDFPVYSYIPRTDFNCRGIESGYYADLETDCQVFHICEEGKKISFLCPNGTIFQQSELICEWWNKVNCTNSPSLYEESAERLQTEVARRKSSRRVDPLLGDNDINHGAVMRTEESTSIRATKNGKEYPIRQQTQRTQRINNHRIPDNNDIEQHIEQAESNNRYLANAQNTQRNDFADQKNQAVNKDFNDTNRSAIQSSGTKQTKKDIDKETGNYFNRNYDQDSTRQAKKVDQGEKNSYNFGSKIPQQKSSTLKEYHVEFGSTSSGIDYSTKSYNPPDVRKFSQITSQNNLRDNKSGTTTNKYYDTNTVQNNQASKVYLADSNKSLKEQPQQTSAEDYNTSHANNDFGNKVTDKNAFSSTPLVPKQFEQNPTTNGKVNRGSVKYNISPTYPSTQQPKGDQDKNQFKSVLVTTYSPPVKFSSSKILQSSQVSDQERPNQDNYDIPFPKHKSELASDQGSVRIVQPQQNKYNFDSQLNSQIPKQSDLSVLSTEVPLNSLQDRTSSDATNEYKENRNHKNQESDEAQIPQESSSFVKSSFNSITDSSFKTSSSPYPNHRSTYSDIKDVSYLEAPKLPSISSITAHLVTTQPINNGKPFVGSRVGTTLLPNQKTTHSKYTYLPTTSTDSSKPTVIFGVIRHSSTTEPPPYGPPELLNLVTSTETPILDRFNLGNTDKTRPTLVSTISITNPVPTQSFNVGDTESTIKPNLVPTYGTSTFKPLDIFVPVHGSLNVGSAETNIDNNQGEGPTNINVGDTSISDRFNFDSINIIGPTVETNKPIPKVVPSFITSTGKPLEFYSSTKTSPNSDRFNIGSTDITRPTIETTSLVTNAVPTETFNIGNTDTTLKPNLVPSIGTSTIKPLEIYVPDHGSLNVGQNEANINGLEPVNEPPFIKKTVPLLYSNENTPISTIRTVDHATVYGTYKATTLRSSVSNKTPYSPTVPTVTQSSIQSSSPFYGSTTSRTPKAFNQGIPIRFETGKDKISVQLSRNFGGQTQTNEQTNYKNTIQPSSQKVNAVVRVGDEQQFGSRSKTTVPPNTQQNGLYVTEDSSKDIPSIYPARSKSKTERPRPFSRTLGIEEDQFNTGNNDAEANSIRSTFPAYQISSARPFGVSHATPSTPFITNQTPPSFSVYDNVDSMMNVLQEIANYNAQKDFSESSRPGLVIPPSVGPQTLHSLAQYFANELQNTDPNKEGLKPETKEKLTSLLTAMTVHGYNNLFNVQSTATPTTTTSSGSDNNIDVGTATRVGSEESSEENNSLSGEGSNRVKDDSTDSNDDLLTTTSLPELRQLARNFSLALSSYLHDPDNFKKSLEGLRPTEPPPLDGSDNVESSTTEDELLNFSDADVRPSTPAIPTATWGYIVAPDFKNGIQDDVKNSLNPDLNTADSQSFIPRFNNVQADEKQQKGFTDLPPNHWTSSPQATKLWQKALSINPEIVNEHFETTPSILIHEEETTEPELFNQDVLPDLTEPHSEISYDLRELPPLSLNSTQVHGILIDFMNHTKSDEHNRLNRILKKLNTSEDEFLDRMKEIESNPLTKRLVLLLISECGANITEELGLTRLTPQQGVRSQETALNQNSKTLSAPDSSAKTTRNAEPSNRENHSLVQLVHPKLNEEYEDARALQLLNSLYTIASKFGRKR